MIQSFSVNHMQNNFLVAINIRCDVEEFKKLLDVSNISYFNYKVETPKIYYDEQTYFVFDTLETRQVLIKKINDNAELIKQINEINFCERE